MDAKALAKSKRSHSQRHSKKVYPNQISKAPSGDARPSIGKKSSEKQVTERAQPLEKQARERAPPPLPSNWDQYKEEFDPDNEHPSQESTSQVTDVIFPKSKGASYAHLIYEARSQPRVDTSFENFPSFDDTLDDLNQGLGPLLSGRGQSILSWIGEDNLGVDDKAIVSPEIPFLSLNLHNLAEQLAKVDLSRRLFVEADLLQPELCIQSLQASGKQEAVQDQPASEAKAVNNDTDTSASHGRLDGGSKMDANSSNHPVPVLFSKDSESFSYANEESSISRRIDGSIPTESTIAIDDGSIPSQFQAEAAEAELDLLLNAFHGKSTLTSNSAGNSSHLYSQQGRTPVLLAEGSTSVGLFGAQPLEEPSNFSRSTMLTNNLDVTIDDVLNETLAITDQSGLSQKGEVRASKPDTASSTSSHPVLKSKLLDDFDSWLDTI